MWTRRVLLKAGGMSLLSFGLGPTFLHRVALAAATPAPLGRRKVLVAIFQRGAMDGLAAVPLLDEPELKRLRPRLALPVAGTAAGGAAGEAAVLDLDGRFGLHPALAPLLPLYQDGRLAVVHAVGSPDPTRSHFDAQDFMETGTPGRKGTPSGWLNRVCGELGHEASPFRAVAITPSLPRSLYGAEPAVAVTNLADFGVRLPGAKAAAAAAGEGFEALYQKTSEELLRSTGAATFDAVEMLAEKNLASYRPAAGADYPPGPLGSALRQIAMLVKADVGLEVAFAETGGWDTHVQQGTAQGGFARRAGDLAQAIAAFWTDLGSHRDEVVVMTMTEFGRTVAENGSGGTDHGHGSCLFLLGQRVAGGQVHGRLESLDRDALFEGRDLPVTTDFRAVFAEVARGHLGVVAGTELFPDWSGAGPALFRPAGRA
jgi:uncharacterized protein (DUF1501 family)